MKNGVMLINTSRGGLVDTRALIDGLKSGKIGSAGLDVYEEEAGIFFHDMSDKVLTDDVLKKIVAGVENLADAVAHVLLARHFERIADQATNVCKEVIYMVRGDYVRHRRPPQADPDLPQ